MGVRRSSRNDFLREGATNVANALRHDCRPLKSQFKFLVATGWAKSQWTNVGLNSSVTECPIERILSGLTYNQNCSFSDATEIRSITGLFITCDQVIGLPNNFCKQSCIPRDKVTPLTTPLNIMGIV